MTSILFVKCSLFILALVPLCAADIATIQVTTFATTGNRDLNFLNNDVGFLTAAADNYIFVHDSTAMDTSSSRVLIYERDAQGTYYTSRATAWPMKPAYVTTNGKWFGSLGSGQIVSFRRGTTGATEDFNFFESLNTYTMKFLSDDTLVLIGPDVIETYSFISSTWTKIQNQPVNFTVVTIFTKTGEPADSAPHVTDATLAAYHPRGAVELYTRNADKSWTLVDEVAIDTTQYRANRILWDGADSLVLGHATYVQPQTGVLGRVLIYSKASGSWTLTDVIEALELNIPTLTFFAYSLRFVHPNMIAIGAPSFSDRGQVFIMQRTVGGPWQITAKIIGRDSSFYFGHDTMTTNYDLVIQTGDVSDSQRGQQVAVSGCQLPISYSCNDIAVDTCQEVVPESEQYQLTELGQCTTVSLVDQFEESPETTKVMWNFTRGAETFYCNATITCPGPPTAPTPATPGAAPISAPTDGPVSPSDGPTSPVASPSTGPAASPVNSPAPSSPVTVPSTGPTPSNVPVKSTPNASSQTSGATGEKWRSTTMLVIVICGLLNAAL